MQKILGFMRKAIKEYDMIQNGDKIAVGISGGKDSLITLYGLVMLKKFIGIDFEVGGITIDNGFNGRQGDFSSVEKFCDELGVKYDIIRTQIGEIVFDIRKEPNPCSLCARMRRGALHNSAHELGYNKIALGHNKDDVIETFMMNLFTEGRIGCFSPVMTYPEKDIEIIRPLVFTPEKNIKHVAKINEFPVVKSSCPADGHTNREEMKTFLRDMERKDHGFKDRIFGAVQRSEIDNWKKKDSP